MRPGSVRPNISAQKTDAEAYVFSNYSYDLAGAMTSQTYPSGRVVTTAYDSAGRTSQVSGTKSGEPNKTYASAFSYTPSGAGCNLVDAAWCEWEMAKGLGGVSQT